MEERATGDIQWPIYKYYIKGEWMGRMGTYRTHISHSHHFIYLIRRFILSTWHICRRINLHTFPLTIWHRSSHIPFFKHPHYYVYSGWMGMVRWCTSRPHPCPSITNRLRLLVAILGDRQYSSHLGKWPVGLGWQCIFFEYVCSI